MRAADEGQAGCSGLPSVSASRTTRFRVNAVDLERCQAAIGYRFNQPALLEQSLTHSSSAATRLASNERMEFLGDAVLGMVVCQEIFTLAPEMPEGDMTKIKSTVVSRQTCAEAAIRLGLDEMLVLGKGVAGRATLPPSLAAAVLESVIGAIYLDGGLEPAKKFILEQMSAPIGEAMASQHQCNYKSLLQQYAQRELNATPQYDVIDEKGPEHSKCFEIAVRVHGRQFASAWGASKKEAEQKAALTALRELGCTDVTLCEPTDEE